MEGLLEAEISADEEEQRQVKRFQDGQPDGVFYTEAELQKVSENHHEDAEAFELVDVCDALGHKDEFCGSGKNEETLKEGLKPVFQRFRICLAKSSAGLYIGVFYKLG